MERELRQGLALALNGDGPAYASFLAAVARLVRGFLMKSRGRAIPVETVEDLVQDVLVAIHKKKHLYQADRPALPWIFAIARYRLIDHARALAARPPAAALEDIPEAALAGAEVPDRGLEVEELLEGLTENQRRAVVLAKMEGRSLAEVGARLGLSLSAVKVTIHRALAALRRGIKKDDDENR